MKETELARACPSVRELLEGHFSFEHLRMVRTRDLVSAVVLPHVDFAEVDSGACRCLRLLVPLETNPVAFHSDPSGVFHMRKGEVWYLDAALVHSAANFSSASRVVVCLDYVFPEPFEMQDAFRSDNGHLARPEPLIVTRKVPGPEFEDALLALSEVMNRLTFRDIAFMLAKLHFSFDVPVGAFHEWIVAVAERTGDRAIADRARHLRSFLLGDRDFGERFSWDWETEAAVV